MGRHRRNDDRSGFSERSFWEVNKKKKLETLAQEAIDSQDLNVLIKDTIKSVQDSLSSLKTSISNIQTAYNQHTHVITGTYTITLMKPFAEARFKSFKVEVFHNEGALSTIKVSDTNGARTDRNGRRKLRKAKRVLIPASTMWFNTGYKDNMTLSEFLALTLKK